MVSVYCLVCNITGEKYYGSTGKTLSQRLSLHKKLDCTSKQIILRGDYDIYKLSEYETKEEAELKEDWYIRNKECVNQMRVKLTDEERKEGVKKRNKEYREKNGEKIKNYKKEYYENNRENHKEKMKEYSEKNREKIKDYKKEWYEKNIEKIKEKMKEKVECEYCGFSSTKINLKRHQRTKSCLTYQKKLK